MTSLILYVSKHFRILIALITIVFLVFYLTRSLFSFENRIVGNWQFTKLITSDTTISSPDSTTTIYSFNKDSTIAHTGVKIDKQRWFVRDDTLNWIHCHLGCDTMQFIIEDFSKEEMTLLAVFDNDLKAYMKRIKSSP